MVDPELLATVPPALTAESGFDALTHAIEGFVARRANPISSALAEQAISLAATYLPLAAAGESTPEIQDAVALAALLALIFDCDGVLVDTEHSGHLTAFNQMWREYDIPWQWTPGQYAEKLRISGGKERLASLYHDVTFRTAMPALPLWEDWIPIVLTWHRRKTQIYLDLVDAGEIQPRPGVRRLAREAARAGWQLAVASSGAPESVHATLRVALGPELASVFTVVTGQSVTRKKPDPEVYLHTAHTLGTDPDRCIAIEDTRNGMLAALAAGIPAW